MRPKRFLCTILVALLAIVTAGCGSSPSTSTSSASTNKQTASIPSAANLKSNFEPNNLPVLYVHIDDSAGPTFDEMRASEDHSVECKGSIDLKVPKGFDAGYGKAVQEDLKGIELDYIRGRGNSTWGRPKSPYKFKLAEDQDLFGMGSNKHWVLMANYLDPSLVHNRLTNWLASGMGMQFSIQDVPVDLVVNDVYQGSYVLCEHLRVGKGRIDIKELKETDKTEPVITGGYLLSLYSEHDARDDKTFTTSRGVKINYQTPSFKPNDKDSDDYECEEQSLWIARYVQQAEDAIFGEGDKPYDELIDTKSFADFWLIHEFSRCSSKMQSRDTYLYKDRDGKLCFGPLWDFDLAYCQKSIQSSGTGMLGTPNAMGESDSGEVAITTPAEGFDNDQMLWFDQLRKDPAFMQLLKERWKVLDGLVKDATATGGLLDAYNTQLGTSWNYDKELWGEVYKIDGAQRSSLATEIADLRSWLEKRRAWVDANFDLIGNVDVTVTFVANGKEVSSVKMRSGDIFDPSAIPDAPPSDNGSFVDWYVGDKTFLEVSEMGINENLTVEARYATSS